MAHKERDEATAASEGRELATRDRPSRTEMAVALRIHGASYSEIAKACDYSSAHAARIAVEKSLAASVGEDDREQRRHIEARRLERLLRAVMGKATDEENPEQVSYVRASLAIIDRHARLYGLDAPAEVVLYNPTTSEMERWLADKALLMQQDLPEEANIIEGEVWIADDDTSGDDA